MHSLLSFSFICSIYGGRAIIRESITSIGLGDGGGNNAVGVCPIMGRTQCPSLALHLQQRKK